MLGLRVIFLFQNLIKILIEFGVCLCMCVRTLACLCVYEPPQQECGGQGQLRKLVLSFHYVGFRDRT